MQVNPLPKSPRFLLTKVSLPVECVSISVGQGYLLRPVLHCLSCVASLSDCFQTPQVPKGLCGTTRLCLVLTISAHHCHGSGGGGEGEGDHSAVGGVPSSDGVCLGDNEFQTKVGEFDAEQVQRNALEVSQQRH